MIQYWCNHMLTPTQILTSHIVANSTMNRSRGLSGVNSYTKDLRFEVLSHLLERHKANGSVVWYDVCCGEAHALSQAATELSDRGIRDGVKIIGADLVMSDPSDQSDQSNVTLIEGDVSTLLPTQKADLITCVHGLHYIGDKLGLLTHLSGMLAEGGIFIGNIDPANIRIQGAVSNGWANIAKAAGIHKTHLVYKDHILKIVQPGRIGFNLVYKGATASEKPNYTGITVMDSWYDAKIV